jgi:hypothetical protein
MGQTFSKPHTDGQVLLVEFTTTMHVFSIDFFNKFCQLALFKYVNNLMIIFVQISCSHVTKLKTAETVYVPYFTGEFQNDIKWQWWLEDECAVTYCAITWQVFSDGRTHEHFFLFRSWHDYILNKAACQGKLALDFSRSHEQIKLAKENLFFRTCSALFSIILLFT